MRREFLVCLHMSITLLLFAAQCSLEEIYLRFGQISVFLTSSNFKREERDFSETYLSLYLTTLFSNP
jgi:hypothetical protein